MTERTARDEVARYSRTLFQRRLVSGGSGNVSMLLDDGNVLITPTQRSLRDVAPDELVVVDRAGVPRDAQRRPSVELPLHLAAYAVRPDIRCIIHTHPTYCVLWSKTGGTFPCTTVGARETLGEIVWTPYRQPGSRELADTTASALKGGLNVVLMERHGLSTVAEELERAFVLTDIAEEAAKLAYLSRLAGLPE